MNWFFQGSTCMGCVLFTYFFVAETKALSLEQVDELYRHSSIVRSNQYRQVILGMSRVKSMRKCFLMASHTFFFAWPQ
jgi:hypothetical protein